MSRSTKIICGRTTNHVELVCFEVLIKNDIAHMKCFKFVLWVVPYRKLTLQLFCHSSLDGTCFRPIDYNYSDELNINTHSRATQS